MSTGKGTERKAPKKYSNANLMAPPKEKSQLRSVSPRRVNADSEPEFCEIAEDLGKSPSLQRHNLAISYDHLDSPKMAIKSEVRALQSAPDIRNLKI